MRLTGRAKVAGVIGWPVGHSRSPRIHGYWLETHGIDGAYVPLPVRPEDLHAALAALPKLGFAGCNLTLPHKEAALPAMAALDEGAQLSGAVNTVIVRADGGLEGRNTDIEGFRAALLDGAPRLDAARPAVLLGAGGAARAVAIALGGLGFRRLRLVNRSAARAEAMARDLAPLGLAVEILPFEKAASALAEAGILVNATRLGMAGEPPLVLDLSTLPRDAVVSDIVYVPLMTPLLAAAQARGHPVVDGLGMLLHQARPGFAAWFGIVPEVTAELRRHVLSDLRET